MHRARLLRVLTAPEAIIKPKELIDVQMLASEVVLAHVVLESAQTFTINLAIHCQLFSPHAHGADETCQGQGAYKMSTVVPSRLVE